MPTPREIAAWRFEIVSFLTDRALDPAARSRRIRLIVRRGVPLPPSRAGAKDADPAKRRRISKSTLLRWLAAFRAHGISGLEPKPRRDRDRVRRHDATAWVDYAICLLYEQPRRSLTQLVVYLRLRFVEYSLSRSSLARRLRQHPAYAGLRGPHGRRRGRRRLFGVFEADHPHHGWQLDGKGPLSVTFTDGTTCKIHVLSVIDDFSRAVLAVVIAPSESSAAAVRVLKEAILAFGAPERLQCDKGSAFDSQRVRTGVALLGIHRNFVVGRTPEMQGKIERYHGALDLWFVQELSVQEVVDLAHLELLLRATIHILWNGHHHRTTGASPAARLSGATSARRIAPPELDRAFFVDTTARSDRKTGVVKLPNGRFVVPSDHAGLKADFRYDPDRPEHAVLVTRDGRELTLAAFAKRRLPPVRGLVVPPRGRGELQRLVDSFSNRPNCEPGFGAPEVFSVLGELVGRRLPSDARDGAAVIDFYKRHGPLSEAPFRALCARTKDSLGSGRPLEVYLEHLSRAITASLAPIPRSAKETDL